MDALLFFPKVHFLKRQKLKSSRTTKISIYLKSLLNVHFKLLFFVPPTQLFRFRLFWPKFCKFWYSTIYQVSQSTNDSCNLQDSVQHVDIRPSNCLSQRWFTQLSNPGFGKSSGDALGFPGCGSPSPVIPMTDLHPSNDYSEMDWAPVLVSK